MAKAPLNAHLKRSPLHLLHRAGQRCTDLFQNDLGREEVTPRQYDILLTVGLNLGLSQIQLAEITGIDRSTLSEIVDRMLKKGWLRRQKKREDARAYVVRLTDEGGKILKIYSPIVRYVDERILGILPAESRDRFIEDLNLIVEKVLSGSKQKQATDHD